MNQRTQIVSVIALVALWACGFTLQRHSTQIYKLSNQNENIYYLPPSNWLKVLSLGYNEAMADLLWIKCVLYFSTSPKITVSLETGLTEKEIQALVKHRHLVSYIPTYLDAISQVNPRLKSTYLYGSHFAMFHLGIITRDTIDMSIDILKLGLKQYPNDGQLLFQIGFLYYFELPPFLENENVETAKRTGIKYFLRSSSAQDPPPYVALLTANLSKEHNLNDLIVEHLNVQFLTETNPEIRKKLEWSLKSALSKQHMDDIKQMNHMYETWKAQYAYIPFDLYTVLKPPAADWQNTYILEH